MRRRRRHSDGGGPVLRDGPATLSPYSAAGGWADWGERIFLLALFAELTRAILSQFDPANLPLLATEGLVAVFVLLRRPAASLSGRASDWSIAIAATLLPMLVRPAETAGPGWPAPAMMAVGLLIVLASKLSLNRRLGMAPANRGVQPRWAYALVRHPMYLGYLIAQAGFLLHNPTAWNGVVLGATWGLQFLRMGREEAHLAADPAYMAYREKVRFRLVPGVY